MTALNKLGTGKNVFAAIAANADRFPDKVALRDARVAWSYRTLCENAARLASALRTGCAGRPVAVLGDNDAANVLTWLAAARAGIPVALINSLLAPAELAGVLSRLDPAVIVVGDAHHAVLAQALEPGERATTIVLRDGEDRDGLDSISGLIARSSVDDGPLSQPDDLFEISYTSGTTSLPKGAMLSQQVVLARARMQIDLLQVTDRDAAMVVTPLFHQSGIRDTVLVGLLAGASVTITPRFDAPRFWELVREHGVTYGVSVETILSMLDRQPPQPDDPANSIRRLVGAGDPDLLSRFETRFGVRLINAWGMTETGMPVAVPLDYPAPQVDVLRRAGDDQSLAGWPRQGVHVRIIDEHGKDVAAGAAGELVVSGPTIFGGYYRDPAATAEVLSDGWFRTGDLVRQGEDGALYYLDRIRDVIRRGGENIAARQVEAVLDAHPAVARSAVIGVRDPVFVQEVKAVIEPRAGMQPSPEELWAFAAERLARYKVPRYLEFRDRLPVNGSGRIQKQRLREETSSSPIHDRRAGADSDA